MKVYVFCYRPGTFAGSWEPQELNDGDECPECGGELTIDEVNGEEFLVCADCGEQFFQDKPE